mmetsp:Transcript_8002/g.13305  ORF Transcript_8002/g.13305 Transcript_8002/m.13305 type:complete len:204 (-) Transcript_8002:85-696(-)
MFMMRCLRRGYVLRKNSLLLASTGSNTTNCCYTRNSTGYHQMSTLSVLTSCFSADISRKAPATQPVSRKKRKESATGNHTEGIVLVDYDFHEEARKTLRKIYDAVQHMKELNENFTTKWIDSDSECNLVIQTPKGRLVFTLDAHRDPKTINLQSYISGLHYYQYVQEEQAGVQGVWLSIKDDHDMRGLVTRDLIRHCAGCPHI